MPETDNKVPKYISVDTIVNK